VSSLSQQPGGSDLVVRTADGRALTGKSFGPVDGNPVLFVAGAGTGKSMRFGEQMLDRAHVRLLTMDRPGMGGSDVHPERTLASTAADYRAFVTGVLGAGVTLPVVANSQGSVFGLAAAAAGWVSRLVLVSPADEVAHPDVQAQVPEDAARLAQLAADDPDEAARILGAFTADAMAEMVLSSSDEADRRFYTSETFLPLYRRSLAEGFANDGAGYVRDTLIAMQPWPLRLGDVRCPVTILFGARDRSHSPDHGRTLADRIPDAVRQIVPDAGGALLWTHSEKVLAAALGQRD